jgi:hypothetical protein
MLPYSSPRPRETRTAVQSLRSDTSITATPREMLPLPDQAQLA